MNKEMRLAVYESMHTMIDAMANDDYADEFKMAAYAVESKCGPEEFDGEISDADFSKLMSIFLRAMSNAQKDDGLDVDNVKGE